MGWKTIAGVIVLGLVFKRALDLCFILQPFKTVYNHAPGPCHLISPVENGSEDMQYLPNGKVIMSSGIKLPSMAKKGRIMNGPGQFYVFDFNSPQESATVVPCDNFPDYGTKYFAPHGLSVLEHQGEVFIFVVNHDPRGPFEKDTVEKFRYITQTNSLEHLKTYSGDYFRMINDVLALGPESFYVTNWIYNRNVNLQRLELIVFNLHWSSVLYYNEGKTRTVAEGLVMANGISMSPDKRHIYVVTTDNTDIKVYRRNSDDSLSLVQSKVLPTVFCDNMYIDGVTGDVWAGCHPVVFQTTRHLEEPDDHRPPAPSQVLRIGAKDGLLTDVTEVYANDGSGFNVSSIALYNRRTSAMLVGSVEGRLLYCEVKHV